MRRVSTSCYQTLGEQQLHVASHAAVADDDVAGFAFAERFDEWRSDR